MWSVSELVDSLAAATPLVVAIDDLHWADKSSLELMFHLAHRLRSSSALLIGTYREADVDQSHPLSRVLRDLHREHLTTEIRVRRLPAGGTRAMISSTLGGTPTDALVDVVHRHTDGNAFFVQEIVRTLVARGDAVHRDGLWDCPPIADLVIPRSVEEAISERLSRLSQSAQDVLAEASVLGQTFAFEDVLDMGGRNEEELDRDLEEATNVMVVRVVDGDRYAFNHALTQHFLYRSMSPRHRRRLHLAAAEAIEQKPRSDRATRAAEIAWHFREADARERALQYAILAGDQAESRYAHLEAVRFYRGALDLVRETEEVQPTAAIIEKIGWVLTNHGSYNEALFEVELSRSMYRNIGDLAGEVRTTVQMGSIYRATGSPDVAIDEVQALLSRVDSDAHPAEVAELNIVLETLCYTTAGFRKGWLRGTRE